MKVLPVDQAIALVNQPHDENLGWWTILGSGFMTRAGANLAAWASMSATLERFLELFPGGMDASGQLVPAVFDAAVRNPPYNQGQFEY